jgi:hypothetical protein
MYTIWINIGGNNLCTTIGHNRQVTRITQSNNTFKQDTNTKHNNKEHPTTMNTKQIRTTEIDTQQDVYDKSSGKYVAVYAHSIRTYIST